MKTNKEEPTYKPYDNIYNLHCSDIVLALAFTYLVSYLLQVLEPLARKRITMGGSQSQDVQNHQLAKFAATGSLSSVRAERTKPQDEKNIQTLTRLITAKSVREKERANEESEYNQASAMRCTCAPPPPHSIMFNVVIITNLLVPLSGIYIQGCKFSDFSLVSKFLTSTL